MPITKKVILCVDDEETLLISLKSELHFLLNNQYTIETALGGEDALSLFDELTAEGKEVAMVISDYIMDDMNGDELLIKLHQKQSSAIKILLTGQAGLKGVTNAVNNASLFAYISKPWAVEDIGLTIKNGLNSYLHQKEIRERKQELEVLNEALEEKVIQRTLELKKQNKKILSSINYAKRMQSAFLPELQEIKKSLPLSFIFDRPRDVVSGDFFFYKEVKEYKILGVVDCTGHGVPGAFMSMLGNVLLHQITGYLGVADPEKILDLMNYSVRKILKQDKSRNNDGMDVAIVALDVINKRLSFAGANQSFLYVRKNKLHEIKGTKHGIGGLQKSKKVRFTSHEVPIDSPISFYLTTDGYLDQFGEKNGEKFMNKRFKKLLVSIEDKPIEERYKFIENAFEEWKGNELQIDDVLVLGVYVDPENKDVKTLISSRPKSLEEALAKQFKIESMMLFSGA